MEATNRPVDEGLLEHLLGLESSKIGYYAEVKQKIRELEAINRHLRVRTNELQAVFGAIKDGVAVFDATGKLQYCNGVWAQIFPGAGEEPATCQRFFHPARACDAQGCPVSDALRGEVRDDSFAVETGDGTRYLETTTTPIEDADGRFARALVFLRDVTEKRTREIQLLQAEKLTSLGVLAAGVAHEINNPLTSVAGYAEALLRRFRAHGELASDPRLEDFPEYLDVIVREAHRCKTIIESLLSFSRKSERGVGEVDLRALIDEVLQLLGPMARSQGTALLVDTQTDVPGVRGDATALRQVILNLATNALQAVGEGGTVRIRLRHERGDAVLEVEDDGPGIPEPVLEQIWNPFFTTKDVGKGLGLGLAVSYNIVRRHGGEISVRSAEGLGSTFSVVLPVHDSP
ncbi:ATP-binding protein [Deferrisoma palaeochoriense]